MAQNRKRVAVVGSGSFGTAVSRLVSMNIKRRNQDMEYNEQVSLWVHSKELSQSINKDHINAKYLPKIALPASIEASSSLSEVLADADVLIFVIPHQFLLGVLQQIKREVVLKKGVECISLSKGLSFTKTGPELLSETIARELDLPTTTPVAVLMGANIAEDVARDHVVEATLACHNTTIGHSLAALFASETFLVHVIRDVATVELCGALKNVVAMGTGFCDGMDLGPSTKAALMRRGLIEMGLFCSQFSDKEYFSRSTLLESCGVADLIATCTGGRNHRCAAEFARRVISRLDSVAAGTNTNTKTNTNTNTGGGGGDDETVNGARGEWADIERELLSGQRLQGLAVSEEVTQCLASLNCTSSYPLLVSIYKVALMGADPRTIFQTWKADVTQF